MNIIFITNTLNQVGGIERFISILSDYFIESLNYNVTIIDLHSKEFNGFFSLNKNINLEILNISPLENLSIKSKMFKMKEVGEKVSNVLKNYEADIIITFHPSVSRYILFQKNKFKKSKIIVIEHNNHNVYSKKANIINLFTYKKADKLVVFTEYEKNFYNQFIKNVKKIPHANSFKNKIISKNTLKRVIAVGRLEEVKGYSYLIDAFELVCKANKEWELNIIGDGSQKLELENKIRQKGLNKNIKILPFTKNIKEEYLKSSIFVLSSKFEGFGLVLIEAMECGLPIVSFDIPSAKEILSNEEDSLLVESFNISKFADALLMLINDDKKRSEYAKNAKRNAKKYSIENIAKQWEDLFKELNSITPYH